MGLLLSGQSIGMILVALGIGYIVCSMAAKEKGALKVMGYVVGAAVTVVGVVILVNIIFMTVAINRQMGPGMGSGMMQRKGTQPYIPSMQPESTQNQTK